MEPVGTEALTGIITAVVAITTILARLVEKVVDHLLSKKKKEPEQSSLNGASPKGYTTDLAVQRQIMQEVQGDVDRVRDVLSDLTATANETRSALRNNVPDMIDQLKEQHKITQGNVVEIIRSFRQIERALTMNTNATNRLHDLLADVLRQRG